MLNRSFALLVSFTSGTFVTTTGVTDVFILDDVICTGNEATLLDCSHSPIFSENCTAPESILITCQ